MAETITLLLFAAMLLTCILTGLPVLLALAGGLVCFCLYAGRCGYSPGQIGGMIGKGIRDSRTILIVFALIGCLTAVWRAAGTIPCIVYYSASSMSPRFYLLLTFFLCCGMSALTGTSFGTVSTMGVICAGIGTALGISPVYTGGAVMSGIYFGEQCSPMSSSTLLVCDMTGVNIYDAITRVFKNVLVPLALTAIFYLWIGRNWGTEAAVSEASEIFRENYRLGIAALLPAAVIVGFSVFRVRVEVTMAVSILCGALIAVLYQGMTVTELAGSMIGGYRAGDQELAVLVDGGGIASMVSLGLIVAVSSSYFGIFSSTGLLKRLNGWVESLCQRSSAFLVTVFVSVITCAISCNQTLASMLTCEMTRRAVPDKGELALNLGMSVIVIAGLIPWSIAAAFPLSVLGAPGESLLYAAYLYLVPGWGLVRAAWQRKRENRRRDKGKGFQACGR